MSIIIKDGEGNGPSAGVTVNHRLKTTGIDLTLIEAASETGDTYNLNTTSTSLTTSGESALLYIKNLENTNLIIDSIVVNIKDYAGTAGQPTMKIYRNPSVGTLISDATVGEETNRNYGSSKLLSADVFQGAEGKTITAQDAIVSVFLPSTAAVTLVSFDTIVVLPRGASIAIAYTPPSGITSVDIVVAVNATLNGTQL